MLSTSALHVTSLGPPSLHAKHPKLSFPTWIRAEKGSSFPAKSNMRRSLMTLLPPLVTPGAAEASPGGVGSDDDGASAAATVAGRKSFRSRCCPPLPEDGSGMATGVT